MTDKVLELEARFFTPEDDPPQSARIRYTSIRHHSAGSTFQRGAGGGGQHSIRAGSYFLVDGVPADFDFTVQWNWCRCAEIGTGAWQQCGGMQLAGPGLARLYL